MPPPRTKSNSASPVAQRGRSAPSTSRSRTGADTPAPATRTDEPPAAPLLLRGAVGSSTSVFHSWQPGHCPCHRAVSLPHSRQKYAVFVFAIPSVSAAAQYSGGPSLRGE
jgi:hypothetical protein